MRVLKDLIVIILISFFLSLVLYLAILPKEFKPKTYKEFTFDHFFR